MNAKRYLQNVKKIIACLIPGIMVSYLWRDIVAPYLFIKALDHAVFDVFVMRERPIFWADYLLASGANIKDLLISPAYANISNQGFVSPKIWGTIFVSDWLNWTNGPANETNIEFKKIISSVLVATIANNWRDGYHTKVNLGLVETIILWGIDVNRPGIRMLTPFHAAMCFDRVGVLEILVQHGLRLDREQIFDGAECAVMNGSKNTLMWLFEHKLIPETLTQQRQQFMSGPVLLHYIPSHSSLLHIACYFERFEIAEMLRDTVKLDPDVKNDDARSPSDICHLH